jgi:hypothetical protein
MIAPFVANRYADHIQYDVTHNAKFYLTLPILIIHSIRHVRISLMDTRSYTGVTRSDVDRIRKGIGKFGIKMPEGDDVEIKGPLGVKMGFSYDEPNETLTLSVIDKPGFVSDAQIWKVIESTAIKNGAARS